MSRGFGAREAAPTSKGWRSGLGRGTAVGQIPIGPVFEKASQKVFETMMGKGSEEMYNIVEFFEKFKKHTAGEQSTASETKRDKRELVRTYKILPAEVKALIGVDKKDLKGLYRGIKDKEVSEDPANDYVNGKFVYGFTPHKDLAEDFAAKGFEKGAVITPDDLVDYEGGIDLVKFSALLVNVNDMIAKSILKTDEQRRIYDEQRKSAIKDKLRSYEGAYLDDLEQSAILGVAIQLTGGEPAAFSPEYERLNAEIKAARSLFRQQSFQTQKGVSHPFGEREVMLFGVKVNPEWVKGATSDK